MKYSEMKEQAERADAIKSLTPIYFEFNKKGDGFVGRFKGRSEVGSSKGSGRYYQYLFDGDDGLIKCAFGKATDREIGQVLEIGWVYVVTYDGQADLGDGRKCNKFNFDLIDEKSILTEEGERVPF